MTRAAAALIAGLLGAAAHAQDKAAAGRGALVFESHCVLCHGADGSGGGRAAKLYAPRPANLTVSPFADDYKERIIRQGGTAVGRSALMPRWEDQLTDEEIKDVVVYLGTLVKRKNGRAAAGR